MPHELSLLFDSVGCNGYIKLMFEKLSNTANRDFVIFRAATMMKQ